MNFSGKKFVLKMICLMLVMTLCIPTLNLIAASEYSYKIIDNMQLEITISGTNEDTVTVNILALNKTLDELLSAPMEKQKEILIYHNQQKADKNGKAVFNVELPDYGRYSLFYKIGDDDVAQEEAVLLNIASEISELMKTVRESEKSDFDKMQAVKNFITDFDINISLDFNKNIFDSVQDDEIVSYMYSSLKELEEADVTVKTILKLYNRSVFLTALNKGAIENIFKHSDYILLAESPVKDWITKPCLTEKMQKQISQNIEEVSPASNKKFEENLIEKLILAVVEEPDGVGNVKEIMDDFCDLIDITPSKSLTPYEQVEGNSYSSLAELKKAYEKKPSSGNSGGGGSGGGSAGGRGSVDRNEVKIDSEIVIQPEPEKLEIDIYNDLNGTEWAKEYIVELTEKGIVSGKGDGSFGPNERITREEYVKLIVMAFAPDADVSDVDFNDVSKDAWYYPYVCKAYNSGLIKGYENGNFGIGDEISREDMTVIAHRAATVKSTDGEIYLDDFDYISDYAKDAVKVLYNSGIISGYAGKFYPKNPATRAEAAKIICLLLSAI